MSRFGSTSIVLTVLSLAACSSAGNASDDSSDQNLTSAKLDAAGCGDGKKSVPNSWLMSVDKSDGPLFEAVALMSSNLFEITSVSAINDKSDATLFPEDVNATSSLVFELTFTPARDSSALPSAHADSLKNRDKTLLRLQSLGAKVECNNILHRDGAPSVSVHADVDALGCGDGKKSAPNGWFVGIDKSDAPLFKTLALLGSNLFDVRSVTAVIPSSGTLVFPEDASKATSLIVGEGFTPGRDSIALPTIAKDSVANRDKVLRDLKTAGVAISCDQIGVANPLRP
jgi:hypothetical protein